MYKLDNDVILNLKMNAPKVAFYPGIYESTTPIYTGACSMSSSVYVPSFPVNSCQLAPAAFFKRRLVLFLKKVAI